MTPVPDWQVKALQKRKERDSNIPKEWILEDPVPEDRKNVMDIPYTCGIMTPKELKLTEKDATELIGLLSEGKVSSYDLTLAFCKRAAICQQVTNCLAEVFFDEGLKRAKELDEILAKTGKTVGPLHGLPFSIKDQWNIKDKPTAAGFVAWLDNIAEEDAFLIRILREAGAVFYCKTTNPQTLMHLETESNIYGRTLNPFNRGLTPGGSSGGEGAIVGFRASPIGLGADGGGSIRVPAACVGKYGMRSTSQRVPIMGLKLPNGGATPVVGGPICHSARDNELFFKIVLATKPWLLDPSLVPMPWREVPEPSKLKIGYFIDDGLVKAHPPVQRAILSLVDELRSKAPEKFEFVEWNPLDHDKGYDIIRKSYFMDGGAKNYEAMAISGEPVLDNSAWILKESHTKLRSVSEVWDICEERDVYRQQYAQHWNSTGVDVLLCPWSSGVAFRHGMSKYWGYTAMWNLLDYPSITFPSGYTVDPNIDVKLPVEPRQNEFDAYIQSTYVPEEFRDAPIDVQLVARCWQDEELFASLRLIERTLGRSVDL